MYTVFRSPTLTSRRNVQQENNILAKKPGQQSVRKPFGERSTNITEQTPSAKPKQTINIATKNNEQTDDIFSDTCFYKNTYKDVKDNYNDLVSDRDVIGKKGRERILKSFLYENNQVAPNISWVPHPKTIEIKTEIEDDFKFGFDLQINDFNLGLNEVPLPVLINF